MSINNTARTPQFLSLFFLANLLLLLGNFHAMGQADPENAAFPIVETYQRDWVKYPAVEEVVTDSGFYVVGDLHGDYDRTLTLLESAKIIEMSGNDFSWKIGPRHLVFVGDVMSKWDQSLPLIDFLKKLREKAAEAGGGVHISAGNHEAEFLYDPRNLDGKTKVFKQELKDAGISAEEVAAGMDRGGYGQFLLNRPFAIKVNDWFMVHAGYALPWTVEELNEKIPEEVRTDGYQAPILMSDSGMLEIRMEKKYPWWSSGKKESAKISAARLRGYLENVEASHLIIAHKPGNSRFPDPPRDAVRREQGQMFQIQDGLFFMIDVGMSRGHKNGTYSKGSVLHIQKVNGKLRATALYPDKSTEELWQEK